MNDIEELYELILSEDFDSSHLDELISLIEENTKEKTINKAHAWLIQMLPNNAEVVNIMVEDFLKYMKS